MSTAGLEFVRLSDICTTSSGGTPSRKDPTNYAGTIPWVKSGELNSGTIYGTEETISTNALSTSAARLLPAGTLLLAMYGATAGAVARLGIEAATNQAVCAISPGPKVSTGFLEQYLKSIKGELLNQRSGGAQPNLNQGQIKNLKIPLPSLPEQRRIAAILDKADHLRTQRREALAHLDALARSMFDALFGGLADNLMTLKQAGVGFVSGKSLVASGTDGEPHDFVLKVNAVSSGQFDASQVKGLPPQYLPPITHRVAVGDLIVTRASGSKDLIGVATVVDQVGDNVYLPDKLWKATFTGGRTLPEFFRWLTLSPRYRAHVANVSSGAAGVSNISQANLLSFEISLPPLELQQTFATRVAAVERLKEKHRAQLAELDALFASLQHRAFQGEL